MARMCFVAHFAFGAMKGGVEGHMGGVERQTSLMARWLASRGHAVYLVTWDEGQEGDLVIDGVRVLKLCRQDEGLPGLRFFHPRWTSLNRALQRADAELYYQNCGEYVTGQVAMWCRLRGRKFVYSVASDEDCKSNLPEMKAFRERFLYRYGLRHADKIIVQTRKQGAMLRKGFGLEAIALPMPCPGPAAIDFSREKWPIGGDFRVAWVGRIAPVKRLEFLLDVAESMRSITFDVVGKPGLDDGYTMSLIRRAASMPNIILHGHVSRQGMSDIYRNASILCCTSAFEGFPNTFLEAWSYGLPVVSTVDPDNLVTERAMGFHAESVSSFVEHIGALKDDQTLFQAMSANSRKYYCENHALEPAMELFEKAFLDVLAPERRDRA